MSYIAFARKYRPKVFDEIIGQSHITTTLTNAVKQDRVAHAYLFAGPRGVGKTTAARILAKALNCEKGPTPTPCNVCPSCVEITKGASLDVLEIDGASNRGIDEIRNLRDNVKFAPSKGRAKVYIIDEVHMLTPEAFNALLKTLEEPPAHVTFVFATTHPQKVPSTILSRCQRFDFRRLGTRDIAANLSAIAKNEKLAVADDAIALIARHADGSMRDGQVVLDQIVSSASGTVTADDVTQILGVVGEEMLFRFSDAIIGRDPAAALTILDGLIDDGKDVLQTLFGLIEHFRNLSVVKVSTKLDGIINATPETIARYKDAVEKLTIEDILYCITTLTATADLVRWSSLPRIPFEAALVKLAGSRPLVSLDEIAKRLENIEQGQGSRVKGQGENIKKIPDAIEKKQSTGIASSAQQVDGRPPRNDVEGTGSIVKSQTVQDAAVATEEKPEEPTTGGATGLMAVVKGWQAVVNRISPKKMSIASYLQEGTLESCEDGVLTLSFAKEYKFHKEMLEHIDNRKMVEAAIKEVLGSDLRIAFRLAEYPRSTAAAPAGTSDSDAPPVDTPVSGDVDPIVDSAVRLFGGQIAGQTTNTKKTP